MKYLGFLLLLMITSVGNAQNEPITITEGMMLGKFNPSEKLCTLINEQYVQGGDIDRRNLYNLASNGVVMKSIKRDGVDYTQKQYNYRLLKLYSDAFITCPEFRKKYFLVFDSKSIESESLKSQHIKFTELLFEFISNEGTANIKKCTEPNMPLFGSIDFLYENKYSFNVYEYLPETGPEFPLSLEILVAEYKFQIVDSKIKLYESSENKEKITEAAKESNDKNYPPPPPPPPPPSKIRKN